jgi:general secretion pathway protein G
MNRKGFTLTEILIVLVVAGILLALILPNALKAIERGQITQLKSDVNSINTGLYMCFTKERNWDNCDEIGDITDPNELYLKDWPKHPFDGTYSIVDDQNTSGKRGCASGGSTPNDPELQPFLC